MDQSRRRTLQSIAGFCGTVAVVGCSQQSTPTETAASTPTATTTASASPATGVFDGHLDRVPNYDGTIRDLRGQSTVRVRVGVDIGYGPFGFGPPAIHIDPGTTVRWEWTGEGGDHNVVAADGTFDSGDLVDSPGFTFSHPFAQPGVFKYYCEPHRTSQMKGGILVGAVDTDTT